MPYAKIGSDLATNNEICGLWSEDKESKVYPLPAADLLYVDPTTNEKFSRYGIKTIGDLAKQTPEQVCRTSKLYANSAGSPFSSTASFSIIQPGSLS